MYSFHHFSVQKYNYITFYLNFVEIYIKKFKENLRVQLRETF